MKEKEMDMDMDIFFTFARDILHFLYIMGKEFV